MAGGVSERLDAIRHKGMIRSADVARIVDTRPETVSRWRQGRSHPRPEAERIILELEYVIEQLSDLYEPAQARLWLFSPQTLLEGRSPADAIRAGRSDEVRRLVDRVRDAVYM
ncbi:antitoxin Xre/MbcA/ParS toxin-binding domain-containing protein [Salinarimonas rosea]|uniref:antitoxin Xre/MbcA/ParS toxin-binding domain-containing protein n=1 Tax=Salinarimonas rosea TaxID=552063 RepID=UPI00146F9F7B|nr:antitoxin Xre/MbcA/ParS toxin-binding domain-containing protein [Salinarimonas rosea]